MTSFDPYAPPSWDEIQYEWEGLQKAEKPIQELAARVPRKVRTRGSFERSTIHRGSTVGCTLVAQCAESNRRRYVDLLYFERFLEPGRDHAMPIAYASTLLESELDRLVATPARGVATALIAVLTKDDPKQAEILARWARNEVPTMLGILSTLLRAIRRGLDPDPDSKSVSEDVRAFVEARFGESYPSLLRTKELDRNLNYITRVYRNPACHGTDADKRPAYFETDRYEDFVRRVVANKRFRAWDSDGPETDPPGPDVGLLHHHLWLVRDPNQSTQPTPTGPPERMART